MMKLWSQEICLFGAPLAAPGDAQYVHTQGIKNLGDIEDRLTKRLSQEDIDAAYGSLPGNNRFDHEKKNPGYITALLPGTPKP